MMNVHIKECMIEQYERAQKNVYSGSNKLYLKLACPTGNPKIPCVTQNTSDRRERVFAP